jgi:hypothetical protein
MCKASLLKNIGVFSIFHAEKLTVLLSFSNVKEERKKKRNEKLWSPKPLYTLRKKKKVRTEHRLPAA